MINYGWKSSRKIGDIEEMKSILRLLADTNSGFTYELNNHYVCAFTSYFDLNQESMLMEKYKRRYFYHLNELGDNGLSAELGAESKELEFLYQNNQLNYVQIANEGEVSKDGATGLVEQEIFDCIETFYEKIVGKYEHNVKKLENLFINEKRY